MNDLALLVHFDDSAIAAFGNCGQPVVEPLDCVNFNSTSIAGLRLGLVALSRFSCQE